MGDILNIDGEEIPQISADVRQRLERGRIGAVTILDGASRAIFGERRPYATTEVEVEFEEEDDLFNCVRLLRWSDERLVKAGASILWSWNKTIRDGMTIRFAVDWFDKDFFEKRANAINEPSHVSYFSLFRKTADDMKVRTYVLGAGEGNEPDPA